MRKLFFFFTLLVGVIIFISCQDERDIQIIDTNNENRMLLQEQKNELNDGNIPAATVELKPYESLILPSSPTTPPTLSPASLTATLKPGESILESKSLFLPSDITPPKVDVLVCFDLTGSMGGELNNVKVNSVNIMNSVRAVISDSRFGLISHMDYPGFYGGCSYPTTEYGRASLGDYPYSLDQAMTDNILDVASAINALTLGNGIDFPENYTRAFYETYADPNIGFRTGTKKIVLAILDAVPHDCSLLINGITYTTGPDPGRDAIAGTSDDLVMLDVLNQMAANNITVVPIYSGDVSYFSLWTNYASLTGGQAFQINSNGTIPGEVNIADFITSIVSGSITRFNNLKLEVCDPTFSEWLTSSSPASYSNVVLGTDQTLSFDIALTVPAGTPDGVYEFEVCALGDGVELARQSVSITVRAGEVSESCPLSQGYWVNHPDNWPSGAVPMLLGSNSYSKSQLLSLLQSSVKNDASVILTKQLIAAKLNVLNGSPVPTEVDSAIQSADNAIGADDLPMNVRPNSTLGQAMTTLGRVLDDYNNNLLTPECLTN